MSKTGSANGSFLGNFIYDQLPRRRPHFLHELSRAMDFSFVQAALKDFYGVGAGTPPGTRCSCSRWCSSSSSMTCRIGTLRSSVPGICLYIDFFVAFSGVR
jgi:hypothetical protein